MAFTMLDEERPNVTGAAVNVRPVGVAISPLTFVAAGDFDAAVTIEGSPTTESTDDWITLGTLAAADAILTVTTPWERVRAKTGNHTVGTAATVYMTPSA